MYILVTLNSGLGVNLETTFILTANVGTVVPATATHLELLDGVSVEVVNSATSITITPIGECTEPIILSITGLPECDYAGSGNIAMVVFDCNYAEEGNLAEVVPPEPTTTTTTTTFD